MLKDNYCDIHKLTFPLADNYCVIRNSCLVFLFRAQVSILYSKLEKLNFSLNLFSDKAVLSTCFSSCLLAKVVYQPGFRPQVSISYSKQFIF